MSKIPSAKDIKGYTELIGGLTKKQVSELAKGVAKYGVLGYLLVVIVRGSARIVGQIVTFFLALGAIWIVVAWFIPMIVGTLGWVKPEPAPIIQKTENHYTCYYYDTNSQIIAKGFVSGECQSNNNY